jgi:MSHA biogenesis protein MshQ
VGAGVWKHLTFVWDIPSNTAKIFVDGVDQALSGNDGGTTAFSGYQTLYFGDNRSASYFTGQSSADGLIDEALVFDSVLTSAQIQTIFTNQNAGNNYDGSTRVCPGPTIDYFTIDHDNSGINCLAEPVSVTARNADATITTGYTGTITLDTQPLSTTGTWELVTGAGVFVDATANDGEATYTFDATDNGVAAFTLYYPEGEATFDIDVFDGAIRDDDSENDITFAANGFTITASELTTLPPNDPILTQIAGTEFAVYITAFGELPNDGDCGIIETYAGNKNLTLSTAYENPNSGTVNILSSGLAAVTLNFSSGKANLPLNIKYKDVGAVQVGIIEPTFTDISYSNTFVVKPDRFQIAITGVQTATVATDPNVFTTAGSDFTVTVTALDAEGSVTESYGNETSPLEETISVTHSLVAPSLGSVGVLNNVNFENKGNGIFSGDFNWSEVGIIDLTAAVGDGNYLGAGNVVNTFENLGRFTPAYFEVLITNNGIFENKCLAGVGFTYIGENFSYSVNPAFSVTAKNAILPSATTTTTTNYRGAFAKLSLLPFVASGASISVVLNDTSNVGTEGSLLAVDFTAGIVSVDEDPVNFGVVNYRLGSDLYRY